MNQRGRTLSSEEKFLLGYFNKKVISYGQEGVKNLRGILIIGASGRDMVINP
jgi:hypothetical protein